MPEKILIVDDDIDTLHLVGMMLQRQGYKIVASNTGRQALALLQSETPDLMILDIMMPDIDGYEVARLVRTTPAISSIPIIMFTAKSQVDDKVSGYEAGADDYITKPTQPRELIAHVKAVLERSGKVLKEQPAQPVQQAHLTGILATRGGLGSSTLAVNLGFSLYQRTQKEVVVAELRPGEGSIGLDLGCAQLDGLARLLVKRPAEITQAEVQKEIQTHATGLRILPASYQPQDARLVQCVESFEQVARQLAQTDGFVLLDLGTGIHASTAKILPLCSNFIVVTEPNLTTISRTKVLIEELIQKGIKPKQILPVEVTHTCYDAQLTPVQVSEQIGLEVAITFCSSPELISQAVQKNIPAVSLDPGSQISQQYNELADIIAARPRGSI